ncbi:RNA-guided endonuclease InsQ/TnpB family protein [Sulfobacillus harzensis]|uniref:Transposase n=1 Tax=Sulfobacillus harzensis TaxID=2729629 RepID=A0A7Y0L6X8_9FIRM|nr:RNA-guided endonuclease TnpB family protein [Sulfobacillus harzensis]NMP24417.1 transposase [Sulfobacillus harzensis]
MLNGYKFRLYPNTDQQQILLRWIGCQRLIYNAKVQEDRYYRRFQQRMVGTAGEAIPVDQQYSRFVNDTTAFLRHVPSQILRNGAVKFRQAYTRFFQKLGGRPKIKKKTGRQAVWLTAELFQFIPVADGTGGYQLRVGTTKFPVGIIPYVAHRAHAIPASIHIAVEGGQWWLSFAADDPTIAIAGNDADTATERIAEALRHLSADQLAERTLGGDRGVAKPLVTSDGQVFDLQPVQKSRIKKSQQQRQKWQRRAARRRKGSKNHRKAQQKAARYHRYEKNVRHEYAHQTSHQLVANDTWDLYVFEDLKISHMTKRPKAKRDAHGRFLPNGRKAKAGLNRVILASAWSDVVSFTRYKALRQGKLVITVPPQHSSQECAVCTFTSPDNRKSQSEFVCQRCGHTDNADHNAAVVIAQRGITKLLSGIPLTKKHKPTRIFRTLGPERSEVTPGEMRVRRLGPTVPAQRSMSQELSGAIPETSASAS